MYANVGSGSESSARATLSTLPSEVKARIAELSALQDRPYKEQWTLGAPGEDLVAPHQNVWEGKEPGRTVGDFSGLTNGITAVNLFEVCLFRSLPNPARRPGS